MSDETPKNSPIQSDGWKQWSQNVMDSMRKLEKKVEDLEDKVQGHREETLVDVATLKVKAGLMGTVAGLVASAIMSILVGFLVYQITTGHLAFDRETRQPTEPNPISYVLPPRDEKYDPLYNIVSEAKT